MFATAGSSASSAQAALMEGDGYRLLTTDDHGSVLAPTVQLVVLELVHDFLDLARSDSVMRHGVGD